MTDKPFPKTMYAYLDDDEGEYFLLEEEISDCLGIREDAKLVGVYTLKETVLAQKKIEVTVEIIDTSFFDIEEDLPLDK